MPREHNYYVYMVTNVARTVLYIGVTNDLARRESEHRVGSTPGFTQRYHCGLLVYHEHFRDVHAALERERQLKGWKRARKDALIAALNPGWEDLRAKWERQRAEAVRRWSTEG